MARYDAIVIGSGVGGLTAALHLSRNDRETLLLEAAEEPGGYIRPVVYGEYTFDLGLHYLGKLGPGEPFRELLDSLGLEELTFVELDPEGFDRYIFPDYEFRFGKGAEQLEQRLIHDFPKERKGVRTFLDLVARIDTATTPAKLVRENALSWIPYLLKNPVMLRYGRFSYQQVLDRITSDKRLQTVLSAPLFDIAVSPRQASAIGAFGVWALFINGAYYPRGGSRAMRDAYVRRLAEKGVAIRTSSPVDRLYQKGGGWAVRTKAGDEYESRAVISNVDPKVTICSLMDREILPHRVFRKADRLKPSVSIVTTFVGTDMDLSPIIGTGNTVQMSSWDPNGAYEAWLTGSGKTADLGLFINSPSVRDPKGGLAPAGQHVLQILRGGNFGTFAKWAHMPPDSRNHGYDEYRAAITADMIAAAEKYIPGLSGRITFAETFTPLECRDRVGAREGNIYGPAHTPDQMGPGRYPSLGCGIKGLFFAGSGTFGCGISFCAASGYYAAEFAMKYLGR